MKTINQTLVVALIGVAFFAAPAAAISSPLGDIRLGEPEMYVVGFHAMPNLAEGDSFYGARVVSVTPELLFVTIETETIATVEARAALDENVRYIETDVSDHVLHYIPNDSLYTHAAHWGTKKIGLETAWDRTRGTTAVKVAMLDSGLNTGHEEFAGSGRVLAGKNYYKTSSSSIADEAGCSYHGTHTTSTAGATINNGKGIAGVSQHTILPVKIFGGGACFAATTTNLANAIKYAGDQGAHVSSNSWGGGSYSTAINDAITYAHNKGTIHVAAAGNGGCNNCVGNPWVQQGSRTIIVTATDSNDAGASFNSKGPTVDVSAPGVYIAGAYSGTSSYVAMEGTSMACPHVSGVVALIKALNPTMTFASVESRLTSTAVDLGAAGKDDTFGWGRINAAAAVY